MADNNLCPRCGSYLGCDRDGEKCWLCNGTGCVDPNYPADYSSAAIETAKLREVIENQIELRR